MLFKQIFIFSTLFGIISCDYGTLLSTDIIKELIDCDALKIPCPELCNGLIKGKLWAIKMIDAMSKLPSGLFEGNVMDFGNFDECLAIDDEYDRVKGKYCSFGLMLLFNTNALKSYNLDVFNKTNYHLTNRNTRHNMDFAIRAAQPQIPEGTFPLLLSLCLPSTCMPSDFNASATKMKSKLNFVNFEFQDGTCQTNDLPDIDRYDIITITLFVIIVLCVISCTTYDVAMHKMEKKPAHPFLISFSLFTNGRKLLAVTDSPDQLQCMNGLRFISMMWVVSGHRFSAAQALPASDKTFIDYWKHQVYSQYIMGAPLAVDTFLCISGIVLTYSFLKTQRKPKSKFNIILFYVHRYIRLTPAVAALFFLSVSLLKYVEQGPLFPSVFETAKTNCLNYWWSYFLYVQNYVNMNEICWIHTWYISMDMQIFIISPLFLWPLLKFKKYAMYATYAAVVVFIIIPFVITYQYETIMFTQDYYDYYYYVTHTRLAPWIIGLITGVYILDHKSREFKIHWAKNLAIWIVVLVGMGTIVFTGNDILNNFERIKNAAYITLHRPAWSIGICWIVYASVKGRGGIVGWFLSLPAFQVLARLTYSMYIVHVVILMIQIGRLRSPPYLSDYDMFYTYCGDLMMTLITATIWTLLFESPVIIIEKCIFGGALPKKPIIDSNKQTTNDAEHTERV